MWVLYEIEGKSLHLWRNEFSAAINACIVKRSSSWTLDRAAWICSSRFLYPVLKDLPAVVLLRSFLH